MAARLAKWIIFSILLALLPLAFGGYQTAARGKAVTLASITAGGELVLVAAAICAASLGEVFLRKTDRRIWRLVIGGATLLVIMSASLLFADIAASKAAGIPLDQSFVSRVSIWVFVAGLLSSLSSEVFAEVG